MADFSALSASEPIPSVDPKDLRSVWELTHKLQALFVQNSESDGATPRPVSVDVALLAGACSPGANVFAVWARCALLETLVRRGTPIPGWQGTQLDEAACEVAATFPIPALDRFDPDEFLLTLDRRRG
jgi:hypothetical protein